MNKYENKYFRRGKIKTTTRPIKAAEPSLRDIAEKFKDHIEKQNQRRRKIYLSLKWWQKLLINLGFKNEWDYLEAE